MKFAVVELKYVPGRTFIVPCEWIKKFVKNFKQTESFLCFISQNISDEPNFDADYQKEFNGKSGIFKVFVLKVTNSIEDAIIHQREKRLKSVPKKFRDSSNTEAEITAEQKRKRRSEKKIQNMNKRTAMVKNISFLSKTLLRNEVITNTELKDGQLIDSSASEGDEDSMAEAIVNRQDDIALNVSTIYGQVGENCDGTEGSIESSTVVDDNDDYSMSSIEIIHQDSRSVASDQVIQDEDSFMPVVVVPLEQSQNENSPILPKSQLVVSKKVVTKSNAVDKDIYAYNDPDAYNYEPPIDHPNGLFARSEKETLDINRVNQSNAFIQHDLAANDIPTNSNETTDNLDIDAVINLFGQNENMYIVPLDQHFSGIIDSHGNFMSSGVVVDNVQSVVSPQNEPPTDAAGESGSKKKIDELMRENAALLKQNENLSKRNLALQDALVSTHKAVPPVPFETKDGGRLYNGTVFINKTQCEILDKTDDPQKYLNNLALAVFGSQTLKNSSVTGSVSNNHKKPAKPMLDRNLLNLIYSLMASKTNCRCFTQSRINQILNKKIYNLNAVGIPRKSNKK